MANGQVEILRLKQILLSTSSKIHLAELKRQIRRWQQPGAPGQDAINRAMVRAIDEVQSRLDALIRI